MRKKTNAMRRAERFKWLLGNKPYPGMVLRSFEGNPVHVHVDTRADDSASWFVNCQIDGLARGWFLVNDTRGLKYLILPKSQEALLQRHGGIAECLVVYELRVVSSNSRNTALLCEILE